MPPSATPDAAHLHLHFWQASIAAILIAAKKFLRVKN
jgi:hypothetical protein